LDNFGTNSFCDQKYILKIQYVFMFNKKQRFLFKCNECAMIVAIELEDEEDLERVVENKFVLDCPCGGKSCVLRD
jgi:hypothetical protein